MSWVRKKSARLSSGRRALLHADRGAGQFQRRGHVELLADHEALAVVVGDRTEEEALVDLARLRPGRIARQHVDFARCSAVKRSLADSGTKRTLLGSLKMAEATARQKSTSKPVQAPLSSGESKPAIPGLEPQTRLPALLIWSSVGPARRRWRRA